MDKSSEIIPARLTTESERLRKQYRCKHGHTGLSHPSCYVKENGLEERKAILDIECGGLDAGFDIVYCWCLKPINGTIIYDHLTLEDLDTGVQDKRVLESLCEHLWGFDRLILHYGSNRRFDIPFIRTRVIYHGIENLPTPGEMYVTDTYAMAKSLLRLTSNRQARVARAILGKDVKTTIDDKYWREAKYGNIKQKKEAMKYILDHCCHDVEQCEGIYTKMLPYFNERRTSI